MSHIYNLNDEAISNYNQLQINDYPHLYMHLQELLWNISRNGDPQPDCKHNAGKFCHTVFLKLSH